MNLLQPILMGSIIAVCFPVGAWLALKAPFNHNRIAAVMALGAGLLIAALSLDLISAALDELAVLEAMPVMAAAAALFSGANLWLANRGARDRKRCGGCVQQPGEDDKQGSGQAIALGTVMDALPEALVLGVVLSEGRNALALVAALALGNVAQSLSSTAGLKDAGRSLRFIMTLWVIVAIAVLATTVLSFSILGMANFAFAPWVEAFAAGILIAMVAEAMLPEASHHNARLSGLYTATGFGIFVVLRAVL